MRRAGLCLLALVNFVLPAAVRSATAQEPVAVPAVQRDILERADRNRIRGDPSAPVRIVEISDFQCPFCARFAGETFPAVDSLYVESGKVLWVFVSFPNSRHPRAWPAAEAAFCAGAAGRFWPMHDVLFQRQDEWADSEDPFGLFVTYANELGIDSESYAACLKEDQPAPLQTSDYESALRGGITSTPFFVVGDSVAIPGAVSLDDFRTVVDSVLAVRGVTPPR